jgi:hypothetical protein
MLHESWKMLHSYCEKCYQIYCEKCYILMLHELILLLLCGSLRLLRLPPTLKLVTFMIFTIIVNKELVYFYVYVLNVTRIVKNVTFLLWKMLPDILWKMLHLDVTRIVKNVTISAASISYPIFTQIATHKLMCSISHVKMLHIRIRTFPTFLKSPSHLCYT